MRCISAQHALIQEEKMSDATLYLIVSRFLLHDDVYTVTMLGVASSASRISERW